MYEGAAGIPLIVAGPGVPRGKTVGTPCSLIDVFPTVVEAVGARPAPQDADLPGTSLLELAREADDPHRTVFGEYHASHSPSAMYLLRRGPYKYVYYVGYPPQLFDLAADPEEARDLASDPAHGNTVAGFEQELRRICDPEAVDARAKADQQRRIDAAGGTAAVLAAGAKFAYTPAPAAFEPERG